MIDSVKVIDAGKSRIHNIDRAIEETAINMLKQNLDLKLIAQATHCNSSTSLKTLFEIC